MSAWQRAREENQPIISRPCLLTWTREQATGVNCPITLRRKSVPSQLLIIMKREVWSKENEVSSPQEKVKGHLPDWGPADSTPRAVQESFLLHSQKNPGKSFKSASGQSLSLYQVCPGKIINEVMHKTAFNMRTFHS